METTLFVFWGQAITLGQALAALILIILALILGFALGRAGGEKPAPAGARKKGPIRSPSDDAFMKGLTHLMADHTDQAIEEFTRAVTLNSETVETYVVLGNLFRQKGEIERAVRIRQSIIARPQLVPAVRLQALYDLGLDYRKGGLYNRATEAFQEVLSMDASHEESLRQLVSLYEEIRDWENAFETLKRLDKLTRSDSRRILAHYKTERGKELMSAGQLEKAEDSLNQAISADKTCLDAYLHLGDLELARDRQRKAINIWRKAVKLAPEYAHLVIRRVSEAETALGEKTVTAFLDEINTSDAVVTTLLALAQYHHAHGQDDQAQKIMSLAVDKNPGVLDAHRLLGESLLARGDRDGAIKAYGELLKQINGDWSSYQCEQCGFVSAQLTWKCPRCHGWDTMTTYRI
jgi:lipopolysaccharide biosynthesis regulator YciM